MSEVRDALQVLAAYAALVLCGWVADTLLPAPDREAAGVAP